MIATIMEVNDKTMLILVFFYASIIEDTYLVCKHILWNLEDKIYKYSSSIQEHWADQWFYLDKWEKF